VNILFVVHHHLDHNTGAAGSALALVAEYRAAGHDVDVLSFDDLPSATGPRLALPLFSLLVAQRVWRARERLHIVDASTGDAWLWARLRNIIGLRGPVIVTRSHGLEHLVHRERLVDHRSQVRRLSWKYPLYNGGLHLWEVANSLRHADLTFFLNRTEREFAISQLGISAERAHVAHNGLSRGLIASARAGSALTPIADVVGIVLLGTFIGRKGIAYSVPALNALLLDDPRSRVSLIGTGRPASEILPRFSATVRERVNVVESYLHEDLPLLLRGHQIGVLASVAEGFGKSLLEVMACGLAPVATRIPGPDEFISDESNGLLVRPRDERALLDAIRRLVDDPDLLARLRAAARETAAEFGWDRVAARRLALYQQALASPDPSARRRDPRTRLPWHHRTERFRQSARQAVPPKE
jgi:glycosyltransferase involved in cell wall biosynthesis